jgi:hypothetical protein
MTEEERVAALARIDFSDFNYNTYRRHEREKLEPQLLALGFTVKNGRWFDMERDSHGPLSRGAVLMPGEILFTYG